MNAEFLYVFLNRYFLFNNENRPSVLYDVWNSQKCFFNLSNYRYVDTSVVYFAEIKRTYVKICSF